MVSRKNRVSAPGQGPHPLGGWLRTTLLIAAAIGLIVSALSLHSHYSTTQSFCTVNEKINCDVVNRGPYSEVLDVPVALLGVLGYGAFFVLLLGERRFAAALAFTAQDYGVYLAGLATVMLTFALYLTFIEVMVIHAYCVLCLVSQAAVLVLAAGSWWRQAQR